MNSLFMWILLVREAFGFISIKVESPVLKINKSDIDIRCIVDGTNLSKVISIQLNRSSIRVVAVRQNSVVWDAALENKTGVTVNASVSNDTSSLYLNLEISKTVVRYPEDFGSYQCSLLAVDSLGGVVSDHSLIVNITGQYKHMYVQRNRE
uniref:Ig-like domain-containing protein n=1 Tax=Magallana gigas TaxID=29159 RepID=A0A8W8LZY7_MAGGI